MAGAAEKDVSTMGEKELQMLKAEDMKPEVLAKVSDLSKLNNNELAKALGMDSLSITTEKVTYDNKNKRLVHPKSGSLSIETYKGKSMIITKEAFIISEGKKKITLPGSLEETKIDKEGNVHTKKFGTIADKNDLEVTIEGDLLKTNAPSIKEGGKKLENKKGAAVEVISRDTGDYSVTSHGDGVIITNKMGSEHTVSASIENGNKYYSIDNNKKHGLQQGGKLLYTLSNKHEELIADQHSIYVLGKQGEVAKIVAGYKAEKPVTATYNELKDNLPVYSISSTGDNGFTIYKESGLSSSKDDPGVHIDHIESGQFDVDEHSQKGKLMISANGVDVLVSPELKAESVSIKKMKELYAAAPETTISIGKHEVTIYQDGTTDVSRNPFRTTTQIMPESTRQPVYVYAPSGIETTAGASPVLRYRLTQFVHELERTVGSPVVRVEHLGARNDRDVRGQPGVPSGHWWGDAMDVQQIVFANGMIIDARTVNDANNALVRQTAQNYFRAIIGPGDNEAHADHWHLGIRK